MPEQPRSKRNTQDRVITLFTDPVRANYHGYRGLGDCLDRENNCPVEWALLWANVAARGYSSAYIAAVLRKVSTRRMRIK